MTPAYWILPNGKIVFVDDRHIRTVTDNPEMFDYTKRKITAIYKPKGIFAGLILTIIGLITLLTIAIRKKP